MAATGYDDRMLLVEVTGLRQQGAMSSDCTFKVSYRSLAPTLQFIRSRGGRIVRIYSLDSERPPRKQVQSFTPPSVLPDLQILDSSQAALEGTVPSAMDVEGTQLPEFSGTPEPATTVQTELQMDATDNAPSAQPVGLLRVLLNKLKSLVWAQPDQ
ncbi:hypothetical protein HC928_13155 [bacterium]|nr:hypothetical protein [bacterium]